MDTLVLMVPLGLAFAAAASCCVVPMLAEPKAYEDEEGRKKRFFDWDEAVSANVFTIHLLNIWYE